MDAFGRTRFLVGDAGMGALARATVVVVGLGGVGSYAAEALARAAVGKLMLIDPDRVEPSNCNRQLPALHSTIGRPKVSVVADRLRDINPGLQIAAHERWLDGSSVEELLGDSPGYVVDAIDAIGAKVALLAHCWRRGVRVVSSMGAAQRLDPLQIKVGDLFETRGCPLARRVRKRLRHQGIDSGIRVVYSDEPPILSLFADDPEGAPGPANGVRSQRGTISYLPGIIGLVCASVVIQDLLADQPLARRGLVPPTSWA